MMNDDRPGVGRQQMAELRELAQLRHEGRLTDEQYKAQRKRIMARGAAIRATSRGVGGVSTEAIRVSRSYGPTIVKFAIAVVVLAVIGQVGYLLIDRYVINYQPALPEPPVAYVPPPPVQEEPDAVTASAAPPASMFDSDPQAIETVDEEGLPISRAPEAPESETASRRAVFVPPVAEPMSPQELPLTWDVPYEDARPHSGHPFPDTCRLIKGMPRGRLTAYIAVAVGPKAEGFGDPAYIEYRDELREQFESRCKRMSRSLQISALPQPVATGQVMAERMTAANRAESEVALLVTTVQEGRAYAYYYAGKTHMVSQFNQTIGRAHVTEPDSP